MTISINSLKANGHLFAHRPELDDLEFSIPTPTPPASWTRSGSKTFTPQARRAASRKR
jgi:hypothetical protein